MSGFENLAIGYWNMKGLGAQLRAMAMYGGVPFKAECWTWPPDIDYKASEWFTTQKAIYKECNPLINLPYIVDAGNVITQSNACMLYLGRKLDMLGSNLIELSMCEQLLCETYDLRNIMTGFAYSSKSEEEVPGFIRKFTNPNGPLGKCTSVLLMNDEYSNSTPFLVGKKASAPDFHLWEMLDQFINVCKFFKQGDILQQTFPKAYEFHQCFSKLPQMQKYLNSALHKDVGFNNLGAFFGGMPDGSKYVQGTHTVPPDATGMY